MPLDALERAALQQAQAAVIQTKAEAKKGEDGATAINKPINKGLPKAKTAIQSTFASANAADTAAVNAKALAKKHAAKLAESITAAKNAAERALKNKVAADLAYTTVERNLNQKSSALERAAEDAADTAKKAGQAVLPASMTDRMARLIHEEAEATNKRAASERALDAAKLEITKAQERFTTATTVADTTVRCNQGYLSKAWYGPTVTAEEVAARSALDKAQADLSVPDENFNRLEREMAIAVSQRTSYQEKIDEKKALKSGADSASKKAAAALQALQVEVTTLRGEATRLGVCRNETIFDQESSTYRPCSARKLLILRSRNSISDRLLDDVHEVGSSPFALFQKHIGSIRPRCLENPRPNGGRLTHGERTPSISR